MKKCTNALIFLSLATNNFSSAQGWMSSSSSPPPTTWRKSWIHHQHLGLYRPFSNDSGLFSAVGSHSLGKNEEEWKKEGERIILNAAAKAGANPEMINIDWKSGRIVVTVDGSAYIPGDITYEELEFDLEDSDDSFDYESFVDEDFSDDDDEDDEAFLEGFEEEKQGVDVVSIAKAINAAFDEEGEGSVGYNIAVHHEVEVTTPGATDELSGIMFEAYKGFDVIVDTVDAKTGKHKKVEGKLVEKDDQFLHINQKGRMRKFKNELVESVKLPKAKKEKGGKRK